MKISIQEKQKTKLFFWLPSWIWLINLILKYGKIKGKSLTTIQRKKIISAMKLAKKYHRFLVDIDIQTHEGTHVVVKI